MIHIILLQEGLDSSGSITEHQEANRTPPPDCLSIPCYRNLRTDQGLSCLDHLAYSVRTVSSWLPVCTVSHEATCRTVPLKGFSQHLFFFVSDLR